MKKLIAVILSAVMIFSVLAPAASAATGKCNCGTLPTIYVGPLGNTDIYENPGAENERTIFRPTTESIIKIVFKVLPSLLPAVFTRDFTALGDALIESVYEAFGAMALDGNGDSLENVAPCIFENCSNLACLTLPFLGDQKDDEDFGFLEAQAPFV